MKNKNIIYSIAVLLLFSIVFTALAQKDKDKDNGKGKGNNKEQKQDKGHGREGKEHKPNDHDKGNNGKGKDKDDQRNGNGNKDKDWKNDKDDKHHNNGKGNKHDSPAVTDHGFSWNRETFKDRKNIRKQEKVTICHKFNRNNEPAVTIKVSPNALKAHLNHGDAQGECPQLTEKKLSDDWLRTRTNYYATVQNTQEQVIYSRSILDYALERLTGARSQLVVLQKRNVPPAELEQKKQVVVELERNVSALEAVLGVTAALVAESWK